MRIAWGGWRSRGFEKGALRYPAQFWVFQSNQISGYLVRLQERASSNIATARHGSILNIVKKLMNARMLDPPVRCHETDTVGDYWQCQIIWQKLQQAWIQRPWQPQASQSCGVWRYADDPCWFRHGYDPCRDHVRQPCVQDGAFCDHAFCDG